MPKIPLAVFTLFSVLFTFISFPVANLAQSGPSSPEKTSAAADEKTSSRPDMKKAVEEQTKKIAEESAVFDPAKADAINRKRDDPNKKKGWSTKKTLLVVAVAVGAAVGLYFLIKYAKDCARTEPPNCDWINDEFCRCVEYVPRNP
ncbi:MAG: hypothetical protein KF685_11735 [Acidobacteria bacterium]|nr:hypothetical protein [Acidobacteriota bacterium]